MIKRNWGSQVSALLQELSYADIQSTVYNSVIYIFKNKRLLKLYVKYNGRSNEYFTVVDDRYEVLTVHYTEFIKLTAFLKEQFK